MSSICRIILALYKINGVRQRKDGSLPIGVFNTHSWSQSPDDYRINPLSTPAFFGLWSELLALAFPFQIMNIFTMKCGAYSDRACRIHRPVQILKGVTPRMVLLKAWGVSFLCVFEANSSRIQSLRRLDPKLGSD